MNKRCFRCEKQPYGEKLIIPVMSGSDAWQDFKHQLCCHCVQVFTPPYSLIKYILCHNKYRAAINIYSR